MNELCSKHLASLNALDGAIGKHRDTIHKALTNKGVYEKDVHASGEKLCSALQSAMTGLSLGKQQLSRLDSDADAAAEFMGGTGAKPTERMTADDSPEGKFMSTMSGGVR